MTVKDIKAGITKVIFDTFGEKYDVYTESIEQGFKEPCFFVSIINHRQNLYKNNIYTSENQFVVQYFPKDVKTNDECHKTSEKLYEILELIYVDGNLTRAKDMSDEIVDGVLNFGLSYDFFVKKEETKDEEMEEIVKDFGVKDE